MLKRKKNFQLYQSPTRKINGEKVLKRFKSKSRSVLGIDISPTSVKIIEMSMQGKKPCIEAYAYRSLPSRMTDDNDLLSEVLGRLLSDLNSNAKYAAVAVPDSMVISKTIQLVDSLNAVELEELVFYEANKSLIFSSEKINIDFAVLGASSEFSGMLDILLVISKPENIDKRVKSIRKAGLEVKIVDLESYAIARAVEQLITKDKVIGIIELGYKFTRLCIINNGRIIYTREEAFEPKVAQSFIDLALLHIRRNLQFFLANCHEKRISQIYLMGEGGDLVRLAKIIQKELDISTSVVNPLKEYAVAKHLNVEELSQLAPAFLVAFGLALRAVAC